MHEYSADDFYREARQKFLEGIQCLAEARENSRMLGSALLSLHGALEDHIRAKLATNPNIPAEESQYVLSTQETQ
jgi:hypothetical protein